MISEASEAAIDQIVASCNGDIRSALKALLLVNEQLEAELQQVYAAAAQDALTARGSKRLH
jgi:replication-associated recombination protein RarA